MGRHDHVARLSSILIDRLSDAGALIEKYDMAHPELLRSADGHLYHLRDIVDRYADHRLLLLGSGETIIDPRSGQLAAPLRQMHLGQIASILCSDGSMASPQNNLQLRDSQ